MKKRSGTTLIEVTVAILIAAMTSISVFSVVTSSNVSHARADKRELAAAAVRMAQDRLKAYVTSDTSNAFIVGPNNWRLPGDTSGNWALRGGNHDISSWLNNNSHFDRLCRNASGVASCSFTYRVTNVDCGFGNGSVPDFTYSCKTVDFTLIYPD